MKKMLHIVCLEVELAVLTFLFLSFVFTVARPCGVAATKRGEKLSFRFARGQDDLLARCGRVHVAFITKENPLPFVNMTNVVGVVIDASNPYATHVVPAPVGSYGFRFDVHPRPGTQLPGEGPAVDEMHLGDCAISWDALRDGFYYEKNYGVPCYWFRPNFIVDVRPTVVWACAVMYAVIAFALAWFLCRARALS